MRRFVPSSSKSEEVMGRLRARSGRSATGRDLGVDLQCVLDHVDPVLANLRAGYN